MEIEQLEKNSEKFKNAMNESLEAMATAKDTGDEEAFNTHNNDFSEAEKMLKNNKKMLNIAVEDEKKQNAINADNEYNNKIVDALNAGDVDKAVKALEDEANELMAYLTGNVNHVPENKRDDVLNALEKKTDGKGGFTIPATWDTSISEALKAFGGLYAISGKRETTTANKIFVPLFDDTNNEATIIGESIKAPTGSDPVYNQVESVVHKYTTGLIAISNDLLRDSPTEVRQDVINAISNRFYRKLSKDILKGDGADKPKGLLTDLGATNQFTSNTSGKITYDDLVTIMYQIDSAYRNGAVFLISDSAEQEIMKLKDTQGRPLWVPSMDSGAPATILGRPYYVDYGLDAVAANKVPVVYGNFKNFVVREVKGGEVKTTNQLLIEYDQLGIIAFKHFGCYLKMKDAFATMKIKT